MTRRFVQHVFLALVLSVVPIGCDKTDQKQPAQQAGPSSGPVRSGTAIIRGIVTLSGKPPQMPVIPNQPCHPGAKPLKDETVVVDEAGHLQNVVVYLEDAPPSPATQNLPLVVLDQIDCHFVPHVIALQTGQTLRAATSDPTLHNVHGLCTNNPAFNFALVAPGQFKDLTFSQPELFPVRCDVHPWMKAYVYVFAHPWFAVTDQTGRFEIKNVPAGSYTIVAWQEKYGTLRQRITTQDGKSISAPFTYHSGL